MDSKRTTIKALGEIALRTGNMKAMQEFYENILGLELLRHFGEIIFFGIAPGYEGHTQVLALFDESVNPDHGFRHYTGLDAATSPIHHIAFAISLSDYNAEYERLKQLGLEVEAQKHDWIHSRSLYVCDPDGNVVELVCYDPSVQ